MEISVVEKQIAKVVGIRRKWLERNGSRIYERDLGYLRDDLSDGSLRALPRIPNSLDTLGLYHGILGSIQVMDGHVSGWDNISASIGYYAWSIRLRSETYLESKSLGLKTLGVANHAPLLACVASVCSSWDDTMISLLDRLATDHLFQSMAKRRSQHFERFVLAVYAKLRGGVSPTVATGDAPYMAVLEHWKSDDLSSALTDVCNYHCVRIEQDASEEFSRISIELLNLPV